VRFYRRERPGPILGSERFIQRIGALQGNKGLNREIPERRRMAIGVEACIGSEDVSWFDSKLRRRAQRFGVLVAANGITGNASDKNAAHDIVRTAFAEAAGCTC